MTDAESSDSSRQAERIDRLLDTLDGKALYRRRVLCQPIYLCL